MSLEAAIQENTAVLKQLIAVMQSAGVMTTAVAAGASTKAEASADTKQTTTKSTKGTKASADTPKDDAKEDLVSGDPSGTRYFVVTKNKTVGKVDPGSEFPALDGLEVIGGAKYLEWKDTYSKLTAKILADEKKAADAGDGEKTFEVMNAAFQALVNNHKKGQGEGRKAGLAILEKYGVKNVQGAFTKGFDTVMADVNAAMAAQEPAEAAGEFDPFA